MHTHRRFCRYTLKQKCLKMTVPCSSFGIELKNEIHILLIHLKNFTIFLDFQKKKYLPGKNVRVQGRAGFLKKQKRQSIGRCWIPKQRLYNKYYS